MYKSVCYHSKFDVGCGMKTSSILDRCILNTSMAKDKANNCKGV